MEFGIRRYSGGSFRPGLQGMEVATDVSVSNVCNGWSPDHRRGPAVDAHQERRSVPRVDAELDAELASDQAELHVPVRVANLSASGAFLWLPSRMCGLGQLLKLKVVLDDTREVSGTAIIRTRIPGRGNGVEFLTMSAGHRQAIEALSKGPVRDGWVAPKRSNPSDGRRRPPGASSVYSH